MAINYSAPRITARNIATTPSSFNVNQLLGLRSSPYEGLQQVGGQNLYYGDGGFYESYSPSPRQYGRTSYGIWSPMPSWYGIPYQPSYNPIYGYGGGITARGGDVAGTIRRDGQAFKPYTGDIPTGFVKVGEEYEPSMAYLYSKSQPSVRTQPNRMFTNVAGYTPASSNLLGATPSTANSYGAGQYLNTGSGILGGGFSFGTPSGKTAG